MDHFNLMKAEALNRDIADELSEIALRRSRKSPSTTRLCADTGVTRRREKHAAPTENESRK
jgi:hypothetical protein